MFQKGQKVIIEKNNQDRVLCFEGHIVDVEPRYIVVDNGVFRECFWTDSDGHNPSIKLV